jgi:hypothetical protein
VTYQETVASEVASRYGCAVSPSCVQLLPPATVLISGGLNALSQSFHHKPITPIATSGPGTMRPDYAGWGKKNHERKLATMANVADKLRAAVPLHGSYSAAARALGMSVQTVRNYCRELGIASPKSREV